VAESFQLTEDYGSLVRDLRERIGSAQVRAALAVNRELVVLYCQIGRAILDRQQRYGWGAKVIDHLSADLRQSFPELKGFSPRNLKYMRAFAEAYPDEEFVQQVVAQIPWGHNLRILDAVDQPEEREWYVRQTVENGWSRGVLVHQIESGLYRRQGRALTNFERTLPVQQSELARQLLKRFPTPTTVDKPIYCTRRVATSYPANNR
jgi:predicted nuclease of restriction endonuclease-like (RecB) superfamily